MTFFELVANLNAPKTSVRVFHGNAVVPYRIIAEEMLHTEFAARLFGWMTCADLGEYNYWVLVP